MSKLFGEIKFQKKVIANKKECYGTCRASGDRFRVAISGAAFKSGSLLLETILHELLHLWFYIVTAITKKELSERIQHRVIYKVTAEALIALAKYAKED